MTITKRADQLRLGDKIVAAHGYDTVFDICKTSTGAVLIGAGHAGRVWASRVPADHVCEVIA